MKVAKRDLNNVDCPCFKEEDLDKLIKQVANNTHDYYPGSCKETTYAGSKTNGLFLEEVNPQADYPLGIGFGATVGGGRNECQEDDTIRGTIGEDAARKCLEIITIKCAAMKDEICPCFHYADLKSQPASTIDSESSCKRRSAGDTFGLFLPSSTIPLYGVVDDNILGGRKCMKAADNIGDSLEITDNLNPEQFSHCNKILEYTCINDLSLNNF
jgi:hypothetical protein